MSEKNINLLIFDFDWSLVNENSDTWVIEQCAPQIYDNVKALRCNMQWTVLMNHAVNLMMTQHGVSLVDIAAALHRIPVFDEVIDILTYCHHQGIDMAIISDANTYYIDEILNHLNIRQYFKYIVTNTAYVKDSLLRIQAYQSSVTPHNCTLCPINLCKGVALDSLLKEYNGCRVAYVGDGGGDFCPALRLTPHDVICCRENWTLHKMIQRNNDDVKAMVKPWSSGRQLHDIIKSLIT